MTRVVDRRRRRIAAAVLLLAATGVRTAGAQPSAAQPAFPVQAGAVLDRDSATVGDVVRLTIRVRAPLGATINFPAGVDSLGPVQSFEPPTVRSGADSATAADRIAVYRLAPWDVGRLQIELGEILVQTDGGERRVPVSLPSLFVRTVLPADSTLHVPKPARALLAVAPPWPWWWWALAAAAAAALVGLVWWWARRRRGGGAAGDPFADARASFDRVERLALLDAGEHGRHASLMVDVVRRYLAARLPGLSLAMTSRELAAAGARHGEVDDAALARLLNDVDPVKFAAQPITRGAASDVGARSRDFVTATEQRVLAAEAAVRAARSAKAPPAPAAGSGAAAA